MEVEPVSQAHAQLLQAGHGLQRQAVLAVAREGQLQQREEALEGTRAGKRSRERGAGLQRRVWAVVRPSEPPEKARCQIRKTHETEMTEPRAGRRQVKIDEMSTAVSAACIKAC